MRQKIIFSVWKISLFVLLFRPNQKIVVTLQTADLSGECDQDIVVVSSILFNSQSM